MGLKKRLLLLTLGFCLFSSVVFAQTYFMKFNAQTGRGDWVLDTGGQEPCLADGTNCLGVGGSSSGGGWVVDAGGFNYTVSTVGTTILGGTSTANGDFFFSYVSGFTPIFNIDDGILQFEEGSNTVQITVPTLTDNRTVTFPDASGEVSLLGPSIDISSETNLSGGTNITLNGDTLNVDDPVVADLTGNADTATALAANGANCSAGSAPLGVDASGAAESCTDYIQQSELLDEDNMATNSATQPASQQSIKAYVDTQDAAQDECSEISGCAENALTTVDISTNTNLSAGTNITLNGDTLNVDDSFVANTGDTMTGILVLDDTTIQIQEGADTLSISAPALTADRTVTFPDAAGEVSVLGQTIGVAELAAGTDGELITWDASGNPATVSVGTSGQVLTSNGPGAAPSFQDASGGLTAPVDISSQTNLSAGTNITLNGDTLNVDDAFLLTAGDTMAGNIVMGDNSITGVDTITFTDAAGTIAGIQNQNLLDKSATETISGAYTFSNQVIVTGTMDSSSGDTQISTGTGKTMEEAGEIFHDTDNDDLKLFNGTSSVVLATPSVEWGFSILNPAGDKNYLLMKRIRAITITDVHCAVDPADSSESLVIDLEECDSTGDNCTPIDSSSITCDNDGAEDDGSLSNGTIDAGDWLNLDTGTLTGTVGTISITVVHTIDGT